MKKADADLTLENEQLDQYLEAAEPDPPVVVVQYRKRGIPSWVVFLLVVLTPLGSIAIYHFLFFERYRVQAEQSKRTLDRWLESRPSVRPIQGNEGAVPLAASPQPGLPAPEQSGKSGSAPAPLAATAAPVASSTATVSAPPTGAAAVSAAGPPAGPPTPRDAPSRSAGPGVTDPIQAASLPANPATAQPKENPPLSADGNQPAVPADGSSTAASKPAGPRLRTILANPFADADPPAAPAPLVPQDGAGPALGRAENAARRAQDPLLANKDANKALPAPAPLPSREESLRQFEEEAAKKQAEILTAELNRERDRHARRYEERVKFREELREILRTRGKEAAPDIDSLAKRYGFDVDPVKKKQAEKAWRVSRKSLPFKVRMIRSLDLPESLILDFLSDDLYVRLRTRNGPHNESELRIIAAKQLLGFELTESDPAAPQGGAAGSRANPAQTVAPRGARPGSRP